MAIPASIRALVKQEGNSLAVKNVPYEVPNLAPNEVLVKIRAVGLNPTDWKHAFTERGRPGTIVGCDASGDVVSVGSAVTHLKVGDRVAGSQYGTKYTNIGSFAEYNRFECALVFKIPDSMSYEEAASYPIPHYTPVQAFYGRMNLPMPSTGLKASGTILIWGGGAATGWHAIQLAKISGLRIITTASPRNHADLLSLGADACVDYRDPRVVEKIREAAGGEEIMYAMDCAVVGDSLERCLDAVSEGGQVWGVLLPSEKMKEKAKREGKRVDWVLMYTMLGYEIKYGPVTIPPVPSDRELALHWGSVEFPRLAQKGLIKPLKLRKMPGGLEKVEEGLRIMQEGSYSAEKLVYKIA